MIAVVAARNGGSDLVAVFRLGPFIDRFFGVLVSELEGHGRGIRVHGSEDCLRRIEHGMDHGQDVPVISQIVDLPGERCLVEVSDVDGD